MRSRGQLTHVEMSGPSADIYDSKTRGLHLSQIRTRPCVREVQKTIDPQSNDVEKGWHFGSRGKQGFFRRRRLGGVYYVYWEETGQGIDHQRSMAGATRQNMKLRLNCVMWVVNVEHTSFGKREIWYAYKET